MFGYTLNMSLIILDLVAAVREKNGQGLDRANLRLWFLVQINAIAV